MRKRVRVRERPVDELLAATDRIDEPKITPVLEGMYRMQGPVDEAETQHQTSDSWSAQVRKKGRVDQSLAKQQKSGECNVCAAPCSMCLHYNQALPMVESNTKSNPSRSTDVKEEDGFSYVGSGGRVTHKNHDDDDEHASRKVNKSLKQPVKIELSPESLCISQLKDSGTVDANNDMKDFAAIWGRKVNTNKDDGKNNFIYTNAQSDMLEEKTCSNCSKESLEKGPRCSSCHHGDVLKNPDDVKNDFTQHGYVNDQNMESTSNMKIDEGISGTHSKLRLDVEHEVTMLDSLRCAEVGIFQDNSRDLQGNVRSDSPDVSAGPLQHLEDNIKKKSCLPEHASFMPEDAVFPSSKATNGGEEKPNAVPSDQPRTVLQNVQMSDDDIKTVAQNEEEEEIEEDVKVCDICGDVGREEQLAICTRCSDGAEHIYCMRVRLDEVPTGEWLCEECKTEADSKKQRHQKSEADYRVSMPPPLGEKFQKFVRGDAFKDSKFDKVMGNLDGDESHRVLGTKLSSDTGGEKLEAPETSGRVLERIEPKKRPVLNHENSFKMVLEKAKQAIAQTHQTPSSPSKLQAQSIHGSLVKSTSFNNSREWKVKEISSSPIKEMARSALTKVSSPKDVRFNESLNKAKLPPLLDARVNSVNHSIPGSPSIRSSAIQISTPKNPLTPLCSPKTINSTKQINHGTCQPPEDKSNTGNPGRTELKRPPRRKPPGIAVMNDAINEQSSSRLTSPVNRSPTPHCQQCNQAGHFTQFCVVDKLDAAAVPPLNNGKMEDWVGKRRSEDAIRGASAKLMESSASPSMAPESSCIVRRAKNPACKTWNDSENKPQHLSGEALFLLDQSVASTIPQQECIWSGNFVVMWFKRSTDSFGPIQAHISSTASLKVREAISGISQEIQLKEVPRIDIWPPQFAENGAKVENIGLYFFAGDVLSYANCYKTLVEKMLTNDTALRADVGSVELLVFTSDLLPDNHRRWNKMYFLWGVFRRKKFDDFLKPNMIQPISSPDENSSFGHEILDKNHCKDGSVNNKSVQDTKEQRICESTCNSSSKMSEKNLFPMDLNIPSSDDETMREGEQTNEELALGGIQPPTVHISTAAEDRPGSKDHLSLSLAFQTLEADSSNVSGSEPDEK